MTQNDARLQMMLDEEVSKIDVREELRKILDDVKAVRAQTLSQATAAVKGGQTPGVMDLAGVQAVPRVMLAEHDLTHIKVAVFQIRDHVVYELAVKGKKATSLHPKKIQEALKKGLGAAFTDHHVEGWRDDWVKSRWGIWVQHGLANEAGKAYFAQIVPKNLDAALDAA